MQILEFETLYGKRLVFVMTRRTLILTLTLGLVVSIYLVVEGISGKNPRIERTGQERSAPMLDVDNIELAISSKTDTHGSDAVLGDDSQDVSAVLLGGPESIEEFLTDNGSSFDIRRIALLFSDENFPKFTAAMTLYDSPIPQLNAELSFLNTLYSHPLATSGVVVPRSTNCGKRFCVTSMTSENREALREFTKAARSASSDELTIYTFFSKGGDSVHGREIRMIFSTDPSLNTVSSRESTKSD